MNAVNNYYIHCRLVKTLPCIAAFMSSLNLSILAFDRLRVIVFVGKSQVEVISQSLNFVFDAKDHTSKGLFTYDDSYSGTPNYDQEWSIAHMWSPRL